MENLSSVRDIGIEYLQAHFESNLNHYKNQKITYPIQKKNQRIPVNFITKGKTLLFLPLPILFWA